MACLVDSSLPLAKKLLPPFLSFILFLHFVFLAFAYSRHLVCTKRDFLTDDQSTTVNKVIYPIVSIGATGILFITMVTNIADTNKK